jgi:hypothetical protein
LGIKGEDAEMLRRALLDAAVDFDAVPAKADEYGQRYVLDFPFSGPAGRATIRSVWIVLAEEWFPRFVSCYVL